MDYNGYGQNGQNGQNSGYSGTSWGTQSGQGGQGSLGSQSGQGGQRPVSQGYQAQSSQQGYQGYQGYQAQSSQQGYQGQGYGQYAQSRGQGYGQGSASGQSYGTSSYGASNGFTASQSSRGQYYRPAHAIEQKKTNPMVLILGVVVVILVGIGLYVSINALLDGLTPRATLAEGEEVVVTIEEGSTANEIGAQLVSAGLIGATSQFTQAVNLQDAAKNLKPGSYVFTGGMTVDEMIQIMVQGQIKNQIVLTIPEGTKLEGVAEIVETATEGRITTKMFVAAASNASIYVNSYSFLSAAGANSLEGFLYPETYFVDEDCTADDIIRTLLNQYESEVVGTIKSVTKDGTKYSAYEVLILASIVEKEVASDEDRSKVASVFWNRLTTKGWKLESCATVAYYLGRQPTNAEAKSMPEGYEEYEPYNTYLNEGLPPTPICSPSIASINAVLNPADTNYYFFCSGGEDGNRTTLFAATEKEHLNNQTKLGLI